ncbi:mammalian cell entry protein [Mycolicibacterium sp. 050158]|uniref:mammalian cell entry protein n=1 Tax=Mycolicibacterium sp. 050158 TaxID=3090602 RepID=UPI00299D5F05|nr:mammalian cell entry protein [Mycolicibacterium sp. 050158]MDX1889409.1 mammalian cell entry protein [Mycolicibacterium sp. 050158]
MEDQSADSSDLTADAGAASVPQGKAGRNRHRLPRQKAQSADVPSESESESQPAAETETVELTEPVAAAELTVESSESATEPEPTRRRRMPWRRDRPAAVPAEDGTAPEAGEGAAAAEVEEEVGPAPVLVPHRTAGRVLKAAAVAAGVAFVAAAAFAGATIQPYLADRAEVHTKFVIAETAASAITTLWTYTPDDMEKLPERSARYLGGDFAADYKRYIDAIVAPNKQAQVTNNTQVLGAAVESLTPTEATAIVYTNSVATSPVTKGIPSLRYLSYRLTMKPDGSRWLITQMVAVTKLDLTPRL